MDPLELDFGGLDKPHSPRSLLDPAVIVMGSGFGSRSLVGIEGVHQPGELPERNLKPVGQFLGIAKTRKSETVETAVILILTEIEPAAANGLNLASSKNAVEPEPV